jgi:hypothetical protein
MRVRILKTAVRFSFVLLISFVLLTGRDTLNLTPIENLASTHLYSLMQWEFENVLDKWLYRIRLLLPGNSLDEQAKIALVLDYFQLLERERVLEKDIHEVRNSSAVDWSSSLLDLEDELAEVEQLRGKMRDMVEEIMEGGLDSIIAAEGLVVGGPMKAIGIHFPPVDFRLEKPPRVLVVSPRDRIEMVDGILLIPNITVDKSEALEERIFKDKDFSVLVQATGGVATYPAVVSTDSSLRGVFITTAHEWLHHYLFFHPLGRTYGTNSDMTALNETLATIFGKEIGELAYSRFETTPLRYIRPELAGNSTAAEHEFDFRVEMHMTRLRVGELLGDGKIEEAEQYMEDRRLFLADNGYYIRKLNQAYFAFHGTYADSPSSISPIFNQLSTLRDASLSLGVFVREMADVSTYDEFLELLE